MSTFNKADPTHDFPQSLHICEKAKRLSATTRDDKCDKYFKAIVFLCTA